MGWGAHTAKVGRDRVGVWGEVDELGHRAVGEGVLQVVAARSSVGWQHMGGRPLVGWQANYRW